nr:hypothetical protein [Tanacetum cinerariifolium]
MSLKVIKISNQESLGKIDDPQKYVKVRRQLDPLLWPKLLPNELNFRFSPYDELYPYMRPHSHLNPQCCLTKEESLDHALKMLIATKSNIISDDLEYWLTNPTWYSKKEGIINLRRGEYKPVHKRICLIHSKSISIKTNTTPHSPLLSLSKRSLSNLTLTAAAIVSAVCQANDHGFGRLVSKPSKSFINSSEFINGYGTHHMQQCSLILSSSPGIWDELRLICVVDDDNNDIKGAWEKTFTDDGESTINHMIVSFDLITKEFKAVNLPDTLTKEVSFYVSLSKLRESLEVYRAIGVEGA